MAGHDVDLVHLDVALQPHGRGLGGKAAAQLLRHALHVRGGQAQFRGDLSVRQVQAHEVEAQHPDTQGLVMPGQDRAGQVIEALAAGVASIALAMRLAIIMASAHHRLAVAARTLHLLRPAVLPHHGEALGVVQQRREVDQLCADHDRASSTGPHPPCIPSGSGQAGQSSSPRIPTRARFYTQRQFDGVPLFINVAVAVDDVYSAWRRKAAVIGGMTLLLVGAMAVLVIRLNRELARRRTLEEAARASEATFRLLAENSGDGVCRLDAEGRRLYTSPASAAIYGRPVEELVGRHLLDDITSEDATAVRDAIARLRGGEAATRIEFRAVRPDGAPVWVEASWRALRNPVTGRTEGIVAVKRDVTERKALERRLAALARTDGLTGLPNRRAFDEALALEWSRARRESTPVSLLLLDVDRFKLFNDTYGHPAGDACLRAVAGAVASAVHRPADLVARYGGEEIVVLLPNTSAAGAEMLAEQVRAAVEAVGLTHTANLPSSVVTVSVGVATALPAADPDLFAEALLAAADAALYSAKHSGRNRVTVAASVPPPAVPPPVPVDEEARLAALAAYQPVDEVALA
ncbi:diguanylate cyclase [Paracraurococcus sp. LOR1-02]|uniref:diguanylate cyclase n=2 Tax=Paracraurococcus lichenis TaxID=3064888 RepID=A0ABT9EBM7_9PROT|nr:diguanylate cyclase [Paracraurococcus sp. LOR1-02]MDO9713623.1 diguanylate cyclase [Paracraurococcus sp. LOR1-02]